MIFYVCKHCGNVITKLTDSGVNVVCCGEPMQRLEAGVVDAAREKHVPVASVEGGAVRVQVGSVLHPMTEDHWIEWIIVETGRGFSARWLQPGQQPEAEFMLAAGETPASVYAYCNLHGLWKAAL